MIHIKKLIALAMASGIAAIASAQNDSTFIYLCATDDGQSGLMMLESSRPSDKKWSNHGIEGRITGSDFGAWGSGKKMYNPRVYRDTADGSWHLLFNVDKEGTACSYSHSKDLIDWTVQEYRYPAEALALIPSTAIEGEKSVAGFKGKDAHGMIFKVEKEVVDRVRNHQHYRKQIDAKNSERTNEDIWRFAGIDTVEMTLTPLMSQSKEISDKFIGIFFEDINYAADGGLYAELVQNRDFEYSPADRGGDKKWHATKAWSLSDSTRMNATVETEAPLNPNNSHYLRLTTPGSTKYSLINEGYDGIAVKKGYIYNVSVWVKTDNRNGLKISLVENDGKSIGQCNLTVKETGNWTKLTGSIKTTKDCDSAKLTVSLTKRGTVDLDMVSLMPEATFKGHANGLRNDLAQVLADLKPRFVRFPGGCVAHGDGIDNIYDWKGSIGKLEERTGKRNLWGYHQTRGLGYHEYFQFCEDIEAEPLPVLAAGVPCQNSSTHSHVSHDVLTGNGQQCGIPMDEMGAYIQDILDLIEYANGDITTTWGKKRAEAGHPEPFNLKMIGIGNEDIITDAFKERFLMIFNAIKAKYPEIEVIGTVGPFHEGPDYVAGWEFARENNIPAVDEHYYVSPGWFIHNGDYYDSYNRNDSKVYLGEYASHLPDRASTLEAALSTALYLTNVERNADVVTMTSYAPLLAKEGHTQWRPDLIYFNNTEINLTPDYYVQKMYGNNAGTKYVPAERKLSVNNSDLGIRLGNSIVIDEKTGEMIVRLVNLTPATVNTNLGISGNAVLTLLTGDPDDKDAKEAVSEISVDGTYVQPAYSFSVLRFKNKK